MPPSNKVLNVPRICLSDHPGVKGHQDLPLPLSQETSSRKAKGERAARREGEVERKEGGDIQNTTMTRRCLELALSFCLLHTHTAHTLSVGQRFRMDNNSDRKMAKKAFPEQI